MNRRSFLTLLGAGAVGTVIAGHTDTAGLWRPSPPVYAIPSEPVALQSIDAITWEALRRLEATFDQPWRRVAQFSDAMVDGAQRLGDVVNGVVLSEQLSVHGAVLPELMNAGQRLGEQFLAPAVEMLHRDVCRRGLSVCAPLALSDVLETAVATNPTRSLALRGARAWVPPDPSTGEPAKWLLRFDILGGRA